MFVFRVPSCELFDDETETFIQRPEYVLRLEHSLLSISKWESNWKKPFLSKDRKLTDIEFLDYIQCMSVYEPIPSEVLLSLDGETILAINNYINESRTATWFSNDDEKPSSRVVTSELIYHWMIQANIPIECETWHFSRLLTLIRVIGEETATKKKPTQAELAAKHARLNKARRKKRS